MIVRLQASIAYAEGAELALPAATARHVQVLRLQPGDELALFAGDDDVEWTAQVVAMRRDGVDVRIGAPVRVDRELPLAVTLALAMPANDRMDALVEKATELGAARIVPLVAARSVLRLEGTRAAARQARWQAIAVAASEQCGRTRVPAVAVPQALAAWLAATGATDPGDAAHWLLDPSRDATPIASQPVVCRAAGTDDSLSRMAGQGRSEGGKPPRLVLLSGPEGGLDPQEVAAARAAGYVPVNLGPRVLRADTAPLAALAVIGALLR